jgi:hypothetical protein
MKTVTSHGQQAWIVETPAIEASITRLGGMLAPVSFRLADGRTVQPYYVNPWQSELAEDAGMATSIKPAVLVPLRGDFFCLPFGADNLVSNESADGIPVHEDHQVHGEAAWSAWDFVSCQVNADHAGPRPCIPSDDRDPVPAEQAATRLTLSMDYQACNGSITKNLFLGNKQTYIATEHRIAGFSGAYPLGHHATLAGSTGQDGIWDIFVQPFDMGLVDPAQDQPYGGGEYHSLKAAAEFSSLDRVPSIWRDPHEVSIASFPSRRGFADVAAIYRKPHSSGRTLPASVTSEHGPTWMKRIGWTVAINRAGQYAWYSIKDLELLPATVIWMENQGRRVHPWNGRNSCIGLEETCTFMAAGRARSIRSNPVNQRGIATAIELSPDTPLLVRTIQGVLPLPRAGVSIERMDVDETGRAAFVCDSRERLELPVALDWVLTF